MRRLKYLFESTYVRKHNRNENFIKSIWFITEDEIFEAFAELHDGVDVNIEINFYLKGKNFKHELHKDLTIDTPPGRLNLERTEAYAASGLTPCFEVVITKNDSKEDRRMHAYAIESLHHIEDYSLFDVKRGSGYLKLYLKFDENSLETKSLYHKRSARSFNDLLKDFRSSGYECNISRVFISEGSNKMNLMYTKGHLPIYYMTLEKTYKIELDMLDELAKMKSSFVKLTDDLFNLPNIYQVKHSFDIEKVEGELKVKFLLHVYEK